MSNDFDVQITQVGDKGRIVVEALGKDTGFQNFLDITGAVVGPDGTSIPVRMAQTGPGTYEGEFGLLLRNSEHKGQSSSAAVIERASSALGDDRLGIRAEFVDLVRRWEWIASQDRGE